MRKEHHTKKSFCEIDRKKSTEKKPDKCAFYKHKGDFRWYGIKDEPYKHGINDDACKTKNSEWSNIIRRVLIGTKGESTKFHIRYFEIFPEGCSSLEKHRHVHVVICIKGKGFVLAGKKKWKMEFMDTIYISPDTPHQLINPFKKPFGFFCIVNAKRDKPKVIKKV